MGGETQRGRIGRAVAAQLSAMRMPELVAQAKCVQGQVVLLPSAEAQSTWRAPECRPGTSQLVAPAEEAVPQPPCG